MSANRAERFVQKGLKGLKLDSRNAKGPLLAPKNFIKDRRVVGNLAKPLPLSSELSEVVGAPELSRADVVSEVWNYIRKNKLQNPKDKREIVADDALQNVVQKKRLTMFELATALSKNINKSAEARERKSRVA